MDKNEKQVILPMEEYERLVAAQPEKVVEVKTEVQFIHDSASSEASAIAAVFACIFCGLSVVGLFWGWGWWDAIPIAATVISLVNVNA